MAKHLALWHHDTSHGLPKAFRLLEMTYLGVSHEARRAKVSDPAPLVPRKSLILTKSAGDFFDAKSICLFNLHVGGAL